MLYVYPHNLRGLIGMALFLAICTVWFMRFESKPKKEYEAVTGRIVFFDKQYRNLPYRDFGKYRYLKLDDYVYPFEMYFDDEKAAQPAEAEKLKPGDVVTVYYYEGGDIKEEGVNRHLQYMDKEKIQIFKKSNLTQILCTIMLGIYGGLVIFGIEMYKRKKIVY